MWLKGLIQEYNCKIWVKSFRIELENRSRVKISMDMTVLALIEWRLEIRVCDAEMIPAASWCRLRCQLHKRNKQWIVVLLGLRVHMENTRLIGVEVSGNANHFRTTLAIFQYFPAFTCHQSKSLTSPLLSGIVLVHTFLQMFKYVLIDKDQQS